MASTHTFRPSPGYDTQIRSDQPTVNYNTATTFAVGHVISASNYIRGLIKFDLSIIPTNATVLSANLYLTVASDQANGNSTLFVHRLLRDWALAQATWNIYAMGNSWQTAGAGGANDVDLSLAWGSVSTGANDPIDTVRNIALNLTEFNKLVHEEYPNYGWRLKATENTGVVSDNYGYYSANHGTESLRPALVVTWEAPSGEPVAIAPYYSFFKNFENPWVRKGGLWQPNNPGLVII